MIFPGQQQLLALLSRLKRFGLFVQDGQAILALRNATMFSVIDFEHSWKVDFIVRKPREFSRIEGWTLRTLRRGSKPCSFTISGAPRAERETATLAGGRLNITNRTIYQMRTRSSGFT